MERDLVSKRNSGRTIDLDKDREPQNSTEPEVEQEQENFNAQQTQVVRRYDRIHHEPERYGFLLTQHDDLMIINEDEPCVYQKVSGSHMSFIVLYVDDILLMGNDIPSLKVVKTWLGSNFSMKDLGDASYILGIRIYRDRSRRMIGLSQSTYIDKVLHSFGMQNAKMGYVPVSLGIAISKDQCPKSLDDKDHMSKVPYASAIGSIM
jgi:hypothetical protein